MRQQDRVVLWPAYFDSTKTRKDGRRIPKNLAVPVPKIAELKEAAEELRLDHEIKVDVGYARTPTLKTGMILIKKKGSKEVTIRKMARQLQMNRASSQVDQEKRA